MTHGRATTYRRGCRCDDCTRAMMRDRKYHRLRTSTTDGPTVNPVMVDAAPVAAHIRALVASGWPWRHLAAECGWTNHGRLSLIAQGKTRRVYRTTAARILAVEPLTPVVVDPVVVERLVAGADWRTIGATRQERIEAAELMPSRAEAERRLGLRAGRDFARGAA